MNPQYQRIKNLFLQQSYQDAWEDYMRSIRKNSFIKWDYLVLTASNEQQAESYRRQIEQRLAAHQLPGETEYIVLADPNGKRVGSGGATINVLRYIAEREKTKGRKGKGNLFAGKRILAIHSGGDSKRVPQYSACGKLFSPILRELPDGRPSTLFDELVIGMAGIPARIKDGMLVLSGDVLLLFNSLQIDFQFRGAAAITMKKSIHVGKDHGVFLNDGNNFVKSFLHKQTEANLRKMGAVDEQDAVELDTGAVIFDGELLYALYSLICRDGEADPDEFEKYVSEESRLSFYGDFLYPLAVDATLEDYYEQEPEGNFTQALKECRTELWNVLHEFSIKLFPVSPAEFIHFGTTRELLQLVTEQIDVYEYLGWRQTVMSAIEAEPHYAAYNSIIESDHIGKGVYVENSFIGDNTKINSNSIVSNVALEENVTVPQDCVMSGISLEEENWVVRIYGIQDNPKVFLKDRVQFLHADLQDFMLKNKLSEKDIWEDTEQSLWYASLYPVGKDMREAVQYAMIVYKMSEGIASSAEIEVWKHSRRESLYSSFNKANMPRMIEWKTQLQDQIVIERFSDAIIVGEDYQDAVQIFGEGGISNKQFRLLFRAAERRNFFERIKILYSLSRYMKRHNKVYDGMSYDKIETLCFEKIQDSICTDEVFKGTGNKTYKIVQDIISVNLPVRVNWGGGWTDTPPYCNEHGGTVLNAAIKLNGIFPVQVIVRRLPEYCIEFESQDVGAFGRIDQTEEIQNCHDPFDPFALHKAALLTYGILPIKEKVCLQDVLKEMGGGIYLSTQVIGVPKGSGLGTSSILAGACIKALAGFVGENLSDNEVYKKVLCMEQIMSTGGGWQDQVGGVTPGIKYITTEPGMEQKIRVTSVELTDAAREELQERFALIYTGQRRLARNLLRKVIGGYLSGRRDSILALQKMPRLAVLMRYELERGNIDGFAQLLSEHWEVSKQLDSGSTNTCIDQIFLACEDLIDGKFIAGAGGGGFLMAILKKGVTKDMLRRRLHQVFQDSGVDVWESEFVY